MKKLFLILINLISLSAFGRDFYESNIELRLEYKDLQFQTVDNFTIWYGKIIMSDDSEYCELVPSNGKLLPLSCKSLQFNVCTQEQQKENKTICVHANSRMELLNKEILANLESVQDGYHHKREFDIMKAYFAEGHCSLPIGADSGWCTPSANSNAFEIHTSWPNLSKDQESKDSYKKGSVSYDLSKYATRHESLTFILTTTNFKAKLFRTPLTQ